MDKNVARILRYAQEQLIIVEGLKAASPEVTKGTGRAIAAIHNALWLLESEQQAKGPVLRKRLLPHPVQWSELDDDAVAQDSVVARKYEEVFGSPSTPPQVDPPGGWTHEAIEAAKFPESVKQTAQLSFVAKPLNFLPEMVGGDEIQEASAFNYVFQIKGHTPAKWRHATVREMLKTSIPWEDVATFSDAIHVCNAVWRELLSDYVTVEQPKREVQLPEKVIRWIALGKNAENVVANGFDFGKKDIDRVDSELGVYAKQALDAVEACMKQS